MVDFWEVFGRIVTNKKLRKELCKTCPDIDFKTTTFPNFTNVGLNIDKKHYDNARTIVSCYVTDGPVSMMALGELLMALSSKEFRKRAEELATAIVECGVNTNGASRLFYVALGCMLLDENIRNAFANGFFDRYQYGALGGLERDALATLANAADVSSTATQACYLFWGTACGDFQTFYRGHLHPIVQVYPPQ
jgi:hypothetical protein